MDVIVLLVQTLMDGLKNFSKVARDLFSEVLGIVQINKVGVYFQHLLHQLWHF